MTAGNTIKKQPNRNEPFKPQPRVIVPNEDDKLRWIARAQQRSTMQILPHDKDSAQLTRVTTNIDPAVAAYMPKSFTEDVASPYGGNVRTRVEVTINPKNGVTTMTYVNWEKYSQKANGYVPIQPTAQETRHIIENVLKSRALKASGNAVSSIERIGPKRARQVVLEELSSMTRPKGNRRPQIGPQRSQMVPIRGRRAAGSGLAAVRQLRKNQMPAGSGVNAARAARSYQMAAWDMTKTHDAEAAYLTQFVDPTKRVCGPKAGFSHPTKIAQFRSVTQIELGGAQDAGSAQAKYFPAAAGAKYDYKTNSSGNLGICIIPHYAPSVGADAHLVNDPRANELVSGFTFDPDTWLMNDAPLYKAGTQNGEIAPQALNPMDINFPDVDASALDPGTKANQFGPRTLNHFATRSLAATVSITDTAFNAKGSVWCGDSGKYFMTNLRNEFDGGKDGGASGIVSAHTGDPYESMPWRNKPFAGFTLDHRVRNRGAVVAGRVYEARFLPTNPRIEEAVSHLPIGWREGDTENSVDKSNSMLTFLMNRPALIFVLKGIPSNLSLEVGVTWNVELEVLQRSSLGVILADARLGMDFRTDYGAIAGVEPGGLLGSVSRQWRNQVLGNVGYALTQAERNAIGYPNKCTGDGAIMPPSSNQTANDVRAMSAAPGVASLVSTPVA